MYAYHSSAGILKPSKMVTDDYYFAQQQLINDASENPHKNNNSGRTAQLRPLSAPVLSSSPQKTINFNTNNGGDGNSFSRPTLTRQNSSGSNNSKANRTSGLRKSQSQKIVSYAQQPIDSADSGTTTAFVVEANSEMVAAATARLKSKSDWFCSLVRFYNAMKQHSTFGSTTVILNL